MSNHRLIFFTDDDSDDLLLMQEITDSLGYQCQLFHNGIKLLAELKNGAILPSIIYLDLNMPMADGYEILQEIRSIAALNKTPIVIHTANCNEKCIQKCLELGANYFITKAFSFDEIKSAIEYTLHKDWKTHKIHRENFVYANFAGR